VNDFDELIRGVRIKRSRVLLGIDKMRADVVLDHLRHQAGDRTADAGDHMHDALALGFLGERALDRLDLTFDATDAGEQLFLFPDGMAHCDNIAYPPILCNHLSHPPWGDTVSAMKDHVHETHPGIVKRLKRAEGHLHKVIAMFADGRSCLDLAQQLQAVEKAISEAKKALIHDHVDHCLDTAANGERAKSTEGVLAEFKAISRYL
jgi:DNA-binding FrmR family transcriptional regulator